VVNNGVPGDSLPILPEGLSEVPQIISASIQRLPSRTLEGNTRLNVRFAPGGVPNTFSNVIPVFLENRVNLLRDDGQGLDTESNDGIFSMGIEVSSEELEAANVRLANQPASRRFTQQFVNRQRVGTNIALTGFPTTNFNSGEVITLLATNRFGILKANCPAGSPLAFDWRKTEMIIDLPVVADPTRTWEPCPWPTGSGLKLGKWTFGRLMSDMANFPATGIKPGVFVREWLRTWEVNQTINSFNVPAVTAIKTKLVNDWEAQSLANGFSAGELDLSIAPFRLCAIVNRVDLRPNTTFGYGGTSSSPCNGGEARFVFCALDRNCADIRLLVILEYRVPKCSCSDIQAWAAQWAALNATTPQSAYNAALEKITDEFAGPNADPASLPNKSAINQIRSNEILGNEWVMREWKISPLDGFLQEVTVKNTPDSSFQTTVAINQFLALPSAPQPVPKLFNGSPFLAGSAPVGPPGFVWNGSPTLALNPKRHEFGLNTCNGCHRPETKTLNPSGVIPFDFTHVDCRPDPSTFQVAALSDFLTGLNMP
jgi:hypothetical protein